MSSNIYSYHSYKCIGGILKPFILYVYEYMKVCMGIIYIQVIVKPEEGTRPLETEVVVCCLMWILRTKPRSSARASSILNY